MIGFRFVLCHEPRTPLGGRCQRVRCRTRSNTRWCTGDHLPRRSPQCGRADSRVRAVMIAATPVSRLMRIRSGFGLRCVPVRASANARRTAKPFSARAKARAMSGARAPDRNPRPRSREAASDARCVRQRSSRTLYCARPSGFARPTGWIAEKTIYFNLLCDLLRGCVRRERERERRLLSPRRSSVGFTFFPQIQKDAEFMARHEKTRYGGAYDLFPPSIRSCSRVWRQSECGSIDAR